MAVKFCWLFCPTLWLLNISENANWTWLSGAVLALIQRWHLSSTLIGVECWFQKASHKSYKQQNFMQQLTLLVMAAPQIPLIFIPTCTCAYTQTHMHSCMYTCTCTDMFTQYGMCTHIQRKLKPREKRDWAPPCRVWVACHLQLSASAEECVWVQRAEGHLALLFHKARLSYSGASDVHASVKS